jgi:hypothetical protein
MPCIHRPRRRMAAHGCAWPPMPSHWLRVRPIGIAHCQLARPGANIY